MEGGRPTPVSWGTAGSVLGLWKTGVTPGAALAGQGSVWLDARAGYGDGAVR